ncbi:3-deoxy-D-manno-octulosonic acid transferase [Quillaja saponaria]|uniref:3-deoxy-D-manno-octulosonic acid transferase n=1 Tax=Quillaja saponaria TaxID=32244 RepID=A0AAD7PYD6_QUISA|nr:3-deoxy-D-manno-octulosonic acid transferase [Quillaja saponaria]
MFIGGNSEVSNILILGCTSQPRSKGTLLLFHAVSLGEGTAAIPVIRCCSQRRLDITILTTTTTMSAL